MGEDATRFPADLHAQARNPSRSVPDWDFVISAVQKSQLRLARAATEPNRKPTSHVLGPSGKFAKLDTWVWNIAVKPRPSVLSLVKSDNRNFHKAIWRPTSRNLSAGKSKRSGVRTALRYMKANSMRRHDASRGRFAFRTTSSWEAK